MVLRTQKLKDELEQIIQENKSIVKELQKESIERLNQRPAPKSWSVLQCIEHINRYDAYYLPKIDEKLDQAASSEVDYFKPGILGYRFANFLHPDKYQIKTKTFPSMNPGSSDLDPSILDTFLTHQSKLSDQLERSRSVDLNKIKIRSSVTALLQFKLGDLFRVLVFHDLRHVRQAENAIQD